MVDEEQPLIEFPCRICTDNIERPIQYCECKEDLFFHKKCMEKWINQNYVTKCDVCLEELKINKKVNYFKIFCNYGYILPVMALIIYITVSFISSEVNNKNHNLKEHISTLIFIFLIFIFLTFNFVIKYCSCNEEKIYSLFLTE